MYGNRILIITALLLLAIPTVGCWNSVDINEKAIVAGAGIDKALEEGKIDVYVQLIIPGRVQNAAGSGSQATLTPDAVWVASATGNTVFNAIRDCSLKSGRKLLWSHSKVLVIGEELAREGIDKVMDLFERDHEFRRKTWVLISRGSAKDIMEASPEYERIPVFEMDSIIRGYGATSKIAPQDLNKFLGKISSKTTCAFTAGIEEISSERLRRENKVSSFRLSGTAVFKNYKLVYWLDAYETRGLLFVTGKVESGIVEIKCPQEESKTIAFEIIRAGSKIKPEIRDGELVITVEIHEEGNVGEGQFAGIDLTVPENISLLEKRKADAIKKEVEGVIKKAQQFNTDIFGFGEAVYRKYPGEWKEMEKNWDEIFPRLEVQVKVDAKIRRTGLISNPARIK